MGDCVKGCAEVQVDDTSGPFLVHCCNHSIIEGHYFPQLVRQVPALMKPWRRRSWKSNKVFQITLEMENPTFCFQTFLNNHLKMSLHILIRGHHHAVSTAVSPLHSSVLLLVSSPHFSISWAFIWSYSSPSVPRGCYHLLLPSPLLESSQH